MPLATNFAQLPLNRNNEAAVFQLGPLAAFLKAVKKFISRVAVGEF